MQQGDPSTIGSFAIQGRLGQGAMGAVYLARSPGGRLVAVKMVREELAGDGRFRDRFAREVEAARKVSGAFTAAVVDADPDADRPWLATEYLPGPTLQQTVDSNGPLRPGGVRSLAAGLAEALAAIHRSGLVHRDLKPSNIILTDNGPRVIDFGIARALEEASLTATGMVIGTPGYLSPEQITGARIEAASDMFAFGGVLVFAASGQGPFGSGTADALTHRAVHGQPHLPFLPAPLDDLVRRCLDRHPGARPTPVTVLRILDSPSATAVMAPPGDTITHPPTATKVLPGLAPPPPSMQPQTMLPLDVPSYPLNVPSHPLDVPSHPLGRADAGASFATTRVRPIIHAVIGLLTAWIFGDWARIDFDLSNYEPALITLVLAVIGGVVALRNLRRCCRRRVEVRLTAQALRVTRGRRTVSVPWSGVTRLRIVGDLPRPWLVAWFDSSYHADVPAPRRRHHGGYRIYPVGHERSSKRRQRQLRELRAALNWYAARLHDESH